MENKTIYKAYALKHAGEDWPLWEQSWNKYPTLKTDCAIDRKFKELAREGYVQKLRKLNTV